MDTKGNLYETPWYARRFLIRLVIYLLTTAAYIGFLFSIRLNPHFVNTGSITPFDVIVVAAIAFALMVTNDFWLGYLKNRESRGKPSPGTWPGCLVSGLVVTIAMVVIGLAQHYLFFKAPAGQSTPAYMVVAGIFGFIPVVVFSYAATFANGAAIRLVYRRNLKRGRVVRHKDIVFSWMLPWAAYRLGAFLNFYDSAQVSGRELHRDVKRGDPVIPDDFLPTQPDVSED